MAYQDAQIVEEQVEAGSEKAPVKLSQVEIEKVTEITSLRANIDNNLLIVAREEMKIKIEKQKLESAYLELQQKEAELGKEFSEKYGDGAINVETGEFIPK